MYRLNSVLMQKVFFCQVRRCCHMLWPLLWFFHFFLILGSSQVSLWVLFMGNGDASQDTPGVRNVIWGLHPASPPVGQRLGGDSTGDAVAVAGIWGSQMESSPGQKAASCNIYYQKKPPECICRVAIVYICCCNGIPWKRNKILSFLLDFFICCLCFPNAPCSPFLFISWILWKNVQVLMGSNYFIWLYMENINKESS